MEYQVCTAASRRVRRSCASAALMLAAFLFFDFEVQAASRVFLPVDDSYISEQSPDANYGEAAFLNTRDGGGTDFIGYMKFDISALNGHAISAVTLNVFCSIGIHTLSIYEIADNGWSEHGLTWNNAPALGSVAASRAVGVDVWEAFDLTGSVSGGGVRSLAFWSGIPSYRRVASKESSTAPWLTVTFDNEPPEFASGLMVRGSATAYEPYSGTISNSAGDLDGDELFYSLSSGPAWLGVAPDGTLSGAPGGADIGLNTFTIRVDDQNGGVDLATLEIDVAPDAGRVVFSDDFSSGPGLLGQINGWTEIGAEDKEYNLGGSGELAARDQNADEKGTGIHAGFYETVFANLGGGATLPNIGDWIEVSIDFDVFGDRVGPDAIANDSSGFRVSLTQAGLSADAGYGVFVGTGNSTTHSFHEMRNSGASQATVGNALTGVDIAENGAMKTLVFRLMRVEGGVRFSGSLAGQALDVRIAADSNIVGNQFDTLAVSIGTLDHGFRIDNVSVRAPETTSLWNQYVHAKSGVSEPVLPDFSYAGYRHGDFPTPTVGWDVFDVTNYGATPDDGLSDKAAIESAIAAATANGSGIVFFPPGRFRINDNSDPHNQSMDIAGSRIVLRGSGRDAGGTELYAERHMDPANPSQLWTSPYIIRFKGYGKRTGTASAVVADSTRETHVVTVADASVFQVGQWAVLYRLDNSAPAVAEAVAPYAPDPDWTSLVSGGVHVEEIHLIASIDGNAITFKDPIHLDVTSDGNWSVILYEALEEVGVEDIAFTGNWQGTFVHHASAIDDGGWSALSYSAVVNSWIRDCRFTDWNRVINLGPSAAVSVIDLKIDGNKGHSSVSVSRSTHCFVGMVEDTADHHHASGVNGWCSGTVFWKTTYAPTTSFESHASQPRCTLFDNQTGGFLYGRWGGSVGNQPNHLHHLVFWNFNNTGAATLGAFEFMRSDSVYGRIIMPYVLGFHGVAQAFDASQVAVLESNGAPVEPASLYQSQYRLRTGRDFAFMQAPETKQVPAITWPTPTPIAYGTALDGDEFNAQASVPGSFAYSPVVGTVLPAGARLLEVVFTPDDAINYTQATANVMLTVAPATLTVTVHDKAKTYGEPNPGLTYAIAGFVNGDDAGIVVGAPSVATAASQFSDVGQYMITASGGEADNYVFDHAPAALTIQQRALSITAQNSSRIYGGQNPEFIPIFNGFATGDGPENLDEPPSLTTTATPASPVAIYGIGVSAASDPNYVISHTDGQMEVLKAPLTIFAENKGKNYGEVNPPLSAVYMGFVNGDDSSSLDSPVTLATTAVQNSATGVYPITASGAADNNYEITHLDGALTIASIPLTITANHASRLYGAVDPTFTVSYDGFIDGDDANDLDAPVALTTDATVESPVGQYTIAPGGAADANYTLVFVDGTLDVTPAPLRATARNTSRAYGASNPPFAVDYQGFLNGDGASALDTLPLVVTSADRTSPVGRYHIIASGAAAANYSITHESGEIEVIRAVATMKADMKSRPYGAANPELTVTYMGLANGDDESVLHALPVVATTATPGSPVGTYSITVSGTTAANYTLVPFDGVLTVTKAPLSIVANDESRPFGSANPALTADYIGFVNGDDLNGLNSAVSLSSTATESSLPGMYPIVVTGGGASNYEITRFSGMLTVTPAMLLIRANDAARTYGAANPVFTVTYTGFAPGDDEGVLETPLVIATDATAISPAAMYDITPSNATAANYSVVFEIGSLTVTPAPLAVQPYPQSRVYGAANPEVTAAYVGFQNGDKESDIDTLPTMTSSANISSPVGTYTLTASGAADLNYSFSYDPGELTVTPAPLQITALNAMRFYGGPDPAFAASYQGFVNGDTFADLDVLPSFATAASATSRVGMYEISPHGAAGANYAMSYFPGVLEIVPASLTVRAGGHSRSYGAPNPTFTVGYEGFANDETESVLLAQATLASVADALSPVGDYPITVGGASAENYEIDFIDGNLRIAPAVLTARADDQSRTYGSSNPSLTVTYSGFVNGEDEAVLTQASTLDTSASLTSPVGAYSINLSGGAAANYQLDLVAGALTVSPASVQVKAVNKFRDYGGGTPEFTAMFSGFVNGDGLEDLESPVLYATTATRASPPGLHRITPSGATAANYAFTYADGFLVIGKAPLIVVADNQTKRAGDPNPSLTVTYVGFVNGEDESALISPAQAETAASQASPVGDYPITVGGAHSTNYETIFQTGTLFINPPTVPSVSLTSPRAGSVFPALARIRLTADAAISQGTVAKVEFFVDGIKLGEDTTAPYAFDWPNAGLGSHRLTAVASASVGGTTLSTPVDITVAAAVNSVSTMQGNQPVVALFGEIDVLYLIQASNDLKTWQTIGMIVGNGTLQSFVEQIQANSVNARFYRIIETP